MILHELLVRPWHSFVDFGPKTILDRISPHGCITRSIQDFSLDAPLLYSIDYIPAIPDFL